MSLSLIFQRLAPMHLLTRGAGRLAQSRQPVIAQALIRAFIYRHGIDLREAARPSPADYLSFNDFFTRHLRPGMRPIANASWVSPADGIVSQLGAIHGGQLIQAKQQAYSVSELLGDPVLARRFEGGHFTTVYLSPRDYHRVHLPCAGRLLGMRHVPGTLFSVRPEIVAGIDGLLARNERLVCWFAHPQHGIYAVVLVGAAIVGSIATVWHGLVTPPRRAIIQAWHYADETPAPCFAQGEEIGHFQLGSTVITLMPQKSLAFHPDWQVGRQVRQGQAITADAAPGKQAPARCHHAAEPQ
ncbi:archaetidylserine decarboxylase [Kerstersia sp.]|uniref:archaetidylserine decarboxylase n=1 Tax=Kerstersia sp. TaxID=1930783 RepID=UPI003F92E7C3